MAENILVASTRNVKPELKRIVGFIYAILVILYAISPSIAFSYQLLSPLIWIVSGATLTLLVVRRGPRRFWISWAICTTSFISSTLVYPQIGVLADFALPSATGSASGPLFVTHGALLVAVILATVATYRPPLPAYLPVLVLAAAATQAVSGQTILSTLSFLILLAALLFSTYTVRLILDHWGDAKLVRKRIGQHHDSRSIIKEAALGCIGPLAIVATLIALGWYGHESLEAAIKREVYESSALDLSDQGRKEDVADRNLHKDLLFTVENAKSKAIAKYKLLLDANTKTGVSGVKALPVAVERSLVENRPGRINDRACGRFHMEFQFFGRKSIGLRNECKELVSDVSNYVLEVYDQTSAREVGKLKARSTQGIGEIQHGSKSAEDIGVEVVSRSFLELQLAIDHAFLILDALYYVSYFLLAASFLGATQLVLARKIFSPRYGNTFSLADDKSARPLDASVHQASGSISLRDYAPSTDRRKEWFICAVGGKYGFARDLFPSRIPLKLSCIFQRLLHNSYSTAVVDLDSAITNGKWPELYVPKTGEIVVIHLHAGQEVIFRMKTLVGFTTGVRLRSVYSTHVGLFFLGLSSFHCFAQGEGYIAVYSESGGIHASNQDTGLIFPDGLLAWDRCARCQAT